MSGFEVPIMMAATSATATTATAASMGAAMAMVGEGVMVAGTATGFGAASMVGSASMVASTGGFFSGLGSVLSSPWLSGASALVSMGSAVLGGNARAGGFEFEQQQYAMETERLSIAAKQDEMQRMLMLERSLDSQRAIAMANGYDPDKSASFTALQDNSAEQGLADINTSKLNILAKRGQSQMAGAQAGEQASGARVGGYGTAASSLFSYASSRTKLGAFA